MEDAINSQRAIIFFLWKEGAKSSDIARRLEAVFGESSLSKMTVSRWVKRFKEGRATLEDDQRSGRPATAVNPATIKQVEDLILKDRRITLREIIDEIPISKGSVVEIIHDHLHMSKVAARWVPRLLSSNDKAKRKETCQMLLDLQKLYGETFWDRIITVDETWLPFFNPETKNQSMQWRSKGDDSPVKAKVVPSAGKVMVTVFWDCDGIILIDYLPKGETINSAYYSDLLLGPLIKALQEKRPGKLESRLLLQHDNARPHTAQATKDTIDALGWELVPHPAYSPDLAPSDYHLFGPMKMPLRGKHYKDLKSLKFDLTTKWVKVTPKEFYDSGIRKLLERWDKCIKMEGDYIEKCQVDCKD